MRDRSPQSLLLLPFRRGSLAVFALLTSFALPSGMVFGQSDDKPSVETDEPEPFAVEIDPSDVAEEDRTRIDTALSIVDEAIEPLIEIEEFGDYVRKVATESTVLAKEIRSAVDDATPEERRMLVGIAEEVSPLMKRFSMLVGESIVRESRKVDLDKDDRAEIDRIVGLVKDLANRVKDDEFQVGLNKLVDARKARDQALAKLDFNWETWKSVPVLHDGRVMPLETYAEEMAVLVTGRATWTDPETEIKYQPEELLFRWVTDERSAWLSRQMIRAEHRELRRILDSRRVTDLSLPTEKTEGETANFEALPHPNIRWGSLRGIIEADGKPIASFATEPNGLLSFHPPEALRERREGLGWGDSITRMAVRSPGENWPTSGRIDNETKVVTLTFPSAPPESLKLKASYDYQRGDIDPKGKYVSISQVYRSLSSQSPQFWSAEFGELVEALRAEDGSANQIVDQNLKLKVQELVQHINRFGAVLEGGNLYVIPTLDPRALTKPLDVKQIDLGSDEAAKAWIPLQSIRDFVQGDVASRTFADPAMVGLEAETMGALQTLLDRKRYPRQHLLQLTQLRDHREQLRPYLKKIDDDLKAMRQAHRRGDTAAFSASSAEFKTDLRTAANAFEERRSQMVPIDPERLRAERVIERLEALNELEEDPEFLQLRALLAQAILQDQENEFFLRVAQRMRVLLTSPTQAQIESRLPEVKSDLQKGELPDEKTLEAWDRHSRAVVDTYLMFDRTASQRFPALADLDSRVFEDYIPLEIDEEQVQLSAYPEPGALDIELVYNEAKPFAKAWIFLLISLVIVVASLMVKARGPVFAVGLLATTAALAYSAWGFYLRIRVAGRPPVTNMYETVIWVSFVVGVLGLWFCVLPLLMPGLGWAWRLSGLPIRKSHSPLGGFNGFELDRPSPSERNKLFGRSFYVAHTIGTALTLTLFTASMWLFTASDSTFKVLDLLPTLTGKEASGGRLLTWVVGMATVVASSWYGARAIVSLLLGVITFVPEARRDGWDSLWEQVWARRGFLLGALPVSCFGMMLAHFVGIRNPDILDPGIGTIQAVLRNNYWLSIHVLTIVSSYGAGALAWGLGNIALVYYLFGKYRKTDRNSLDLETLPEGHRPADPAPTESGQGLGARLGRARESLRPSRMKSAVRSGLSSVRTGESIESRADIKPPKETVTLANFAYKAMQVATLLLAVGTILGGLWADVSWGRFWDWDPKEVWALISLLVYLAVLHGRFAGWVGTFGTNVGAVACFSAIVMSWYGVNFILPKIPGLVDGTGGTVQVGLHSYAGGDADGMGFVITAVLLNGFVLLAAWSRYALEMSGPGDVETATVADTDAIETSEAEAEPVGS